MNYKQLKYHFKKKQILSTQRLLKLTRVMFYLLDTLNKIDNKLLKFMVILLGFQYDIYHKLYEVTYDRSYLENAERVKYQLEITLPLIGE